MESENGVQQRVLQGMLDDIRQLSNECDARSLEACVICLEHISDKAEAKPCGHANFDFVCLANWLENSQSCPLCKSIISSVRFQQVSSTEFKIYTVKAATARSASHFRDQEPPRSRPRPRPRRLVDIRQPPHPEDTALEARRNVYRNQLYSLHVGSNKTSGFSELTPARFSRDPELISKAKKWIRRELKVFTFLRDAESTDGVHRLSNFEYLLQFIVAILKHIDLRGSEGQAEDMLQEFLGRLNTKIFLHELRAWLRSPFQTLEAWDHHVQYAKANSYVSLHREREEAYP